MKQIEINYLTSTGYESLYPNVNCASIVDFAENLYSKSEVDGIVSGLNTEISELTFIIGEYIGQFNPGYVEDYTDPEENYSDWMSVVVGFEPKLLVLYTPNNIPVDPDFITQNIEGAHRGVNCLEFLPNGFRVREYVTKTGANTRRGGWAHKDTTYQYIAYKKNA